MTFSHVLSTAFRSLRRQRGTVVIQTVGLAVGLACCGFAGLYIHDARSFDRFHEKGDRIVRVVRDFERGGELEPSAPTSAPMGPVLAAEVPGVESAVRLLLSGGVLEEPASGTRFQESALAYADNSLFDVFTFPFVAGDPATALQQPDALVLTESTAHRYFGDAPALGRTLRLDNERTMTVTGVMADVPARSHVTFDAVASWGTWEAQAPEWLLTQWNANYLYTYLLLAPGVRSETVEMALPAFAERNILPALSDGDRVTLHLQPLSEIYLHSHFQGEPGPGGDPLRLSVFGIVAAFVLLLAAVNMVNLATARATRREREVGVRKAVGAARSQLVVQFLCESLLLAGASFLTAVVAVVVLLPSFNTLAGTQIGSPWAGGWLMPALAMLALVAGLGAGLYPALVLSAFQPATALKGGAASARGHRVRQALVVAQFTVTIVLLAGTAVVYRQLDYVRNQALGFDRDRLVVVDFQGDAAVVQRREAIRDALVAVPGVDDVAFTSSVPGRAESQFNVTYESPGGTTQSGTMNHYAVDAGFVPTMGVEVVAGRNLTNAASDTLGAYLVNEAAASMMGYARAEDAVGQRFELGGAEETGEVVGVVRNFHYESLHASVAPLVLQPLPEFFGSVVVRVHAGRIQGTLPGLERAWGDIAPHRPFDYAFVDDQVGELYRADEAFGRVAAVLAALAMLVGCLGLLGLAAFTAEQRRKEIGIRKVLGASDASVLLLLSREVVGLVFVAVVVAVPVAAFAASQWLETFAYRVTPGPGLFVLAGGVALAVSLLTVSIHTVRAATADPVRALRSE